MGEKLSPPTHRPPGFAGVTEGLETHAGLHVQGGLTQLAEERVAPPSHHIVHLALLHGDIDEGMQGGSWDDSWGEAFCQNI